MFVSLPGKFQPVVKITPVYHFKTKVHKFKTMINMRYACYTKNIKDYPSIF